LATNGSGSGGGGRETSIVEFCRRIMVLGGGADASVDDWLVAIFACSDAGGLCTGVVVGHPGDACDGALIVLRSGLLSGGRGEESVR
jgi:hypothetical protein